MLLFDIGTALLATFASGLLPAFQASRPDIGEILKDESRGASGFRVGRLSRALVIFEIALSCGLLVAAGLMIKSVAKMRNIDTGFVTANVFTARVGFPTTYTDTTEQRRFFDDLQLRLRSIPGIADASLSWQLPGLGMNETSFAIEGKGYPKEADYPRSAKLTVSPGFFTTFAVRVLEGRALTTADREGTLPTAIVNQAFAAKYFANADPIGRRIRVGGCAEHRALADHCRCRAPTRTRATPNACAPRSSFCRSRSITRTSSASPSAPPGLR